MTADIAIVGAGYVGLPLAVEFARVGRAVVCIDAFAHFASLRDRNLLERYASSGPRFRFGDARA